MRLVPSELDLADDEGFSPGKDIFGRKEFAERLTNIVCSLEGPSVLLLDAPWGSGKTTFIRMWRGELSKLKIPSVYFDAFSNDYQADAFLAIASEIVATAEAAKPANRQALEKFKSGALKTAKVLAISGIKMAVKAATLGIIDGEALEDATKELVEDAGSEANSLIDEALKKRLEGHEDDKKTFENFKSALSKLAKALTISNEHQAGSADGDHSEAKSPPLIFIVDELDRCKPPFALEILEKIKHLFSIDGVVFILVTSLSQLQSAVKCAYGDMDALAYLEKFYHLRVLLPSGNPARHNLGVETYLRYLNCDERIINNVAYFASVRPIHFRTLERIAAYCQIITISLPKGTDSYREAFVIAVVCIAKVMNPELYAKMRTLSATYEEVDKFFQFGFWQDRHMSQPRPASIQRVEDYFKVVFGAMLEQKTVNQINQSLMEYAGSAGGLLCRYCDLADGFQFPKG